MASSKQLMTAVATLLALLAFSPEVAQAEGCRTLQDPLVMLRVDTPPALIDQSMSRATITERSRQANKNDDAPLVIGRTEVEFGVDVNPTAAAEPDGHGHFCAAVLSAFVSISWKTTKLLASELEQGGCMYDVIERELEAYVALIRQSRAENEDKIRKAIQAEMRKPVIAPTAEQAKQDAKDSFIKAVSDALNAVNADMNRRKAELDAAKGPSEGRKLCGDAAYEAAFAN